MVRWVTGWVKPNQIAIPLRCSVFYLLATHVTPDHLRAVFPVSVRNLPTDNNASCESKVSLVVSLP